MKLTILYGIDENNLSACHVSMQSIIDHNPDLHLDFHIFLPKSAIDKEYSFRLHGTDGEQNFTLTLHEVSTKKYDGTKENKTYGIPALFFLEGIENLSLAHSRVLALDADVFCKGSLLSLTRIRIGRSILAAVPDQGIYERKRVVQLERLNAARTARYPKILPSEYFNSGVLLINCALWRKYYCFSRTLSILKAERYREVLNYPDQDALNMVAQGKVKYLNVKYNFFYPLTEKTKKKNLDISQTILFHYVGTTKPWHYWIKNAPYANLYLLTLKRMPEEYHQLPFPSRWRETKIAARFYAKKYHLPRVLMYGIMHLLHKMPAYRRYVTSPPSLS